MDKKKILFVDDDKNVLDGLRRLLYNMRNEWDMSFAMSGKEALGLMEHSHYDVIVSDMRMPEMDGAQLLTEVMKRHPFTARFVLSGQSDQETVLKTVGPAHQYLSKPCDPEVLKTVVAHALELRGVLQNEEVRNVVSQIKSLPSVPAIYLRLQDELSKPDVCMSTIAGIVGKDLGLSTKILQLVNSSFFGMPHKIASLPMAVSFLGIEVLKALVFTVKVFENLEGKSGGMLSIESLMAHSFAVASATKLILEDQHAPADLCETAFMAGCMHDVGKLIMISHFPKKYLLLQERCHNASPYAPSLEREIFGTTHAEIGAYLLGLWGFKDSVVEAVAYHHTPGACGNPNPAVLAPLFAINLLYYEPGTDIGPYLDAEKDFVSKFALPEKIPAWRSRCANALQGSTHK